jgi:hypothetical protein
MFFGRSALVYSRLVSVLLTHDLVIMHMSRRVVVGIVGGFAMVNVWNDFYPSTGATRLALSLLINGLLVLVSHVLWSLIVLRTAKVLAKADDALGTILSDVEAQQTPQRDTR